MNDFEFGDESDGSDAGDDWMNTYADAITLLMAFFVLLYAMSTIDTEKYQQLQYSLSEHLGKRPEVADFEGVPDDLQTINSTGQSSSTSGAQAHKQLASALEISFNDLLQEGGALEMTTAGVKLELPGEVVYGSGSADMREDAKATLAQTVQMFNVESYADFLITIEGHTDNQPITTGQFTSNWDLAAVRASRIADFFVEAGIDRTRIRSISYADTRPKVANDTPEGRASNRRVNIIFQPASTADWQPADELVIDL